MQNYLQNKEKRSLLSDNGVHLVVHQRPVSTLLCPWLTCVWSPDVIINSCETVTLLSVAGPPTSYTAGERLTMNDDRAKFTLAPQSVADPLVDGTGRRAGARSCGPRPASRPTARGCTAAARTSATRGRRTARRSSRRGRDNLGLPTCLALS